MLPFPFPRLPEAIMKLTSHFIAGVAAGLLSLGAQAQPGPAAVDCSKAKNPAQCEARQHARAACRDKKGPDHRACMADNQPAPNCARAQNPQRCEARQQAREACKGKYGPERRQCLRDQRKR